MSDVNLEQQLKTLEKFGERYEREHLNGIDVDSMRADWFCALGFFLDHIYFQGRRGTLSEQFKKEAMSTLEAVFGSDQETRTSKFREAINVGIIPTDCQWKTWTDNPLFLDLRRRKAGKRRDIEMVLDSLRFLTSCRDFNYNIVTYSISEVESGRIGDLYRRLDGIRQVGQKVASFYLRDLITCYHLKVSEDDYSLVQPLDTWVLKVATALGVCGDRDDSTIAIEKILQVCKQFGVDPKRFNSGAWYLGAYSFKIVIERLQDGRSL